MDLMQAFAAKYVKEDHPEVTVGDTVKVHLKVKEGNREQYRHRVYHPRRLLRRKSV